jgi:hypothetical protein
MLAAAPTACAVVEPDDNSHLRAWHQRYEPRLQYRLASGKPVFVRVDVGGFHLVFVLSTNENFGIGVSAANDEQSIVVSERPLGKHAEYTVAAVACMPALTAAASPIPTPTCRESLSLPYYAGSVYGDQTTAPSGTEVFTYDIPRGQPDVNAVVGANSTSVAFPLNSEHGFTLRVDPNGRAQRVFINTTPIIHGDYSGFIPGSSRIVCVAARAPN